MLQICYSLDKMKRVGEIVETLLREWRTASPAPDSPVASTRELAARFEISPGTADRALKELVKQGVCCRISKKGTFFRGFPEEKSILPLVGYAATMDYKLENTRVQHKSLLAALRRKFRIRIIWHDELQVPEIAEEELKGLDALVIGAELIDSRVIENLEKFSAPVVLLKSDFLFNLPFHQVMPDFSASFNEAARRAKAAGVSSVMIVYCTHPNGTYRHDCMKHCMLDAGFEPEQIESIPIVYTIDELAVHKAVKEIFPRIDGKFLFVTSDIISSIIVKYAGERGKIAGRDYELLSYDNLDPEDDFLSVIDSCYMKLSEVTMVLLDEILNSKETYRRTIYIPTQLLIRKSAFANT